MFRGIKKLTSLEIGLAVTAGFLDQKVFDQYTVAARAKDNLYRDSVETKTEKINCYNDLRRTVEDAVTAYRELSTVDKTVTAVNHQASKNTQQIIDHQTTRFDKQEKDLEELKAGMNEMKDWMRGRVDLSSTSTSEKRAILRKSVRGSHDGLAELALIDEQIALGFTKLQAQENVRKSLAQSEESKEAFKQSAESKKELRKAATLAAKLVKTAETKKKKDSKKAENDQTKADKAKEKAECLEQAKKDATEAYEKAKIAVDDAQKGTSAWTKADKEFKRARDKSQNAAKAADDAATSAADAKTAAKKSQEAAVKSEEAYTKAKEDSKVAEEKAKKAEEAFDNLATTACADTGVETASAAASEPSAEQEVTEPSGEQEPLDEIVNALAEELDKSVDEAEGQNKETAEQEVAGTSAAGMDVDSPAADKENEPPATDTDMLSGFAQLPDPKKRKRGDKLVETPEKVAKTSSWFPKPLVKAPSQWPASQQ